MSQTAIFDTTEALRDRIVRAVGGPVHVGAPHDIGQSRVSLFLFHLLVNAELRNEPRYEPPPRFQPATVAANPRDALPLDLRYLITVFRDPDIDSVSPNELTTLGKILQVLHARPTLSGERLNGQVVRVTPEPYPMEEISRVWGLFPQDIYRTSVVYLASPVIIDARALPLGQPVQHREQRSAISISPPDLLAQVP